MIGKMLSHYRTLDKLGIGGMGEVYVAEDTKLAVKPRILCRELALENASSYKGFWR